MKTSNISTRVILPAITLVLGLLWLIYGLVEYGWWGDNGPQSGFFPAIVGTLLSVISGFAIAGNWNKENPSYIWASFHPLLAAIAVVLAALIIGFFLALALFIFLWIKVYEKYSWSKAVITTVVTIAIFYGIFSLWLRVPFPEGVIFDWVKG